MAMQITDLIIVAVPAGNLRLRRAEFAAVWAGAERLCREQGTRGITDWYAAGVAVTCRWLAGVIVTDQRGHRFPAHAPATGRTDSADRCPGGGRLIEEPVRC